MKLKKSRTSVLALAILAAFAAPASAAIITQTLGAESQALANGVAGTPNNVSLPGLNISTTSAVQPLGSGYGFSFANQFGAYAVRSSAEGIATGQGNASLSYSIFNDSGSAQNLTMRFKIYGGSIGTGVNSGVGLVAGESLSSSYAASIKVNGNSIFSSAAGILRESGGISSTKTGTDLSRGTDDGSDGVYQWDSQYIDFNLGTIEAGLTTNVLAELGQISASNVGTYTFDCGGGYDGYEGYGGYETTSRVAKAVASNCINFKGTAQGFYGDPASTDVTGARDPAFVFSLTPVSAAVPLPGTLGLALLGFAALASRRRKIA